VTAGSQCAGEVAFGDGDAAWAVVLAEGIGRRAQELLGTWVVVEAVIRDRLVDVQLGGDELSLRAIVDAPSRVECPSIRL